MNGKPTNPEPQTVYREDRVTLDAAAGFDPVTGFYRGEGTIARVGVFQYRKADGTVYGEYVPATTLEDPTWLASCKMAPVTLGHPPALVKADNAKDWVIGQLGDSVAVRSGRQVAPMSITRKDGVDRLRAGTRELSCGYTCTLVAQSGEFQGQRYDAVQVNRKCNHVALVDRARQGSEVRVRMDGAEQVDPETNPAPVADDSRRKPMPSRITIGRVTLDIEDAGQATAISAHLDTQDATIKAAQDEAKALKTKLDQAEGERDAAKAESQKLKTDSADADKKAEARVRARIELEGKAQKVLGEAFKVDASDDDLRKAVILKAQPKAELEGKSSEYLAARFDAVMDTGVASPVIQAGKTLVTKADGEETKADSTTSRAAAVAISRARAAGIDPAKLVAG